jgi:hypothetical protein
MAADDALAFLMKSLFFCYSRAQVQIRGRQGVIDLKKGD